MSEPRKLKKTSQQVEYESEEDGAWKLVEASAFETVDLGAWETLVEGIESEGEEEGVWEVVEEDNASHNTSHNWIIRSNNLRNMSKKSK